MVVAGGFGVARNCVVLGRRITMRQVFLCRKAIGGKLSARRGKGGIPIAACIAGSLSPGRAAS